MKILVLSSGGLDSTVLLHKAVKEVGAENVIALNMFYGQKHAKEQEYSAWQCEKLGVPVYDADLSQVFRFNIDCCALLAGSKMDIKHESYAEQLAELGGSGTVTAYVPFRNGLFLSYAAAVAIQLECDVIYYGAHADDAAGNAYPDTSVEFNRAISEAIYLGSGEALRIVAPFIDKSKAEVVKMGLEAGAPFELTWSCYEGHDKACGVCGTCRDRLKAFAENDVKDPVEYETV